MCKYIVFGGQGYYASGGANDYLAAFDSIEAAESYAHQMIGKDIPAYFDTIICEWTHVMDMETKAIVFHVGSAHSCVVRTKEGIEETRKNKAVWDDV